MNYSTRKHLERLMAKHPERDPFGLRMPNSVPGMDVIESPDRPRYKLPAEVMPGVPWPPGFREDINRWSRSFLGTTNIVPSGMVYVIVDRMAVMRPDDAVKMSCF